MASAEQRPFASDDPTKDTDLDELYAKLNQTDNLEYAVLLAHVLIQEELSDILGLRLRTDSMPKRDLSFELLVGLALAGTPFRRERESLDLLNAARNTIAHRVHRREFEDRLAAFAEREWEVSKLLGFGQFEWPNTEAAKVRAFSWGYHHLWLKLVDLKDRLRAWNANVKSKATAV